MWTREMIKTYAKQELRISYWLSFAVCVVAGLLAGGSSNSGFRFNYNNYSSVSGFKDGFTDAISDAPASQLNAIFSSTRVIPIIVIICIVVLALVIGISVFLGGPVRTGLCSFFIRAVYGDRQFSNLFSSFKGGNYLSVVKTMFFTNLSIFLWSLLLIIPGIIKSYEYRMVPYIISEDPSLTPQQAMQLSSRMTDGEKVNMWVLDLSFIGWNILGAMALGIGILFVNPYVEATWTQLYFVLRQKVLTSPTNM